MLTAEGCRLRQNRLARVMEVERWDVFVTGDYRAAYYFTGSLAAAESPVAFVQWSDTRTALLTPAVGTALAGEVVNIETYSPRRAITRPFHELAARFRDLLRSRPARHAAVDRAWTPGLIEALLPQSADATDAVLALRKRKEADEVDEIRTSLNLCAEAYRAARDIIAPGLTEVDMFNHMASVINAEAGTAVPFPGDFACGARSIAAGGKPTLRKIAPGDLYVLDLFPAPALYFGDVCRTIAASPATDAQLEAWAVVRDAKRMAESVVRPGVRARDVYRVVKEFLDSHPLTEKTFWHHAGHGIGFRGHEAPRLIPESEDIFEVGDVFTLEPGIYVPHLNGGIRLEDNYVVHEDRIENLFADCPLEL